METALGHRGFRLVFDFVVQQTRTTSARDNAFEGAFAKVSRDQRRRLAIVFNAKNLLTRFHCAPPFFRGSVAPWRFTAVFRLVRPWPEATQLVCTAVRNCS
jgi:hypothetical protein